MNFLGIETEHNSQGNPVWLLPVPYEATVTFGRGTAFAPDAILQASVSIEEFDADTGLDITLTPGLYTAAAIRPSASGPESALAELEAKVSQLHQPGRLIVGLGGEHSITPALARAAASRFKDKPLVLYLDAHGDMRDVYEGTPFGHASAGKRLLDAGLGLLEVGVRSLSAEDIQTADRGGVTLLRAQDILANGLEDALDLVGEIASGRLLYVSLDMDVFDPSLVPAVGTPQPGGIGWWEFTALLDAALNSCKALIGADIVELTGPLCDWRLGSCVTAAKAAYRIATLAVARDIIACSEVKRDDTPQSEKKGTRREKK